MRRGRGWNRGQEEGGAGDREWAGKEGLIDLYSM